VDKRVSGQSAQFASI
jgi:hypothetical protein